MILEEKLWKHCMRMFLEQKIELQFVGKIGEKTVVTKNYVVSANCCHTYLLKGDEEIVLKERIP